MATLTRSASAHFDASTSMYAQNVSGLVAGEAIAAAGMPCYIKNDGAVWLSNGTAATAPAECRGFSAKAAAVGEPVTLLGRGARFQYGSGLTPGASLYVSATAGQLDDAATTGGTKQVAFVINATDIMVLA